LFLKSLFVTGRDQDVLVDSGWHDEKAAAALAGIDGRIREVIIAATPLTGALYTPAFH